MKIVYLDQMHWIELAKAINKKTVKPGTYDVLNHMIVLNNKGKALFPLSISHYFETLKQSNPDRRLKLAKVMRQISGGKTVAQLEPIVSYEIQVALKHFFSNQVTPQEFSYLGEGFEHAFGKKLIDEKPILKVLEAVPEKIRAKIKTDFFEFIELTFLSGVMKLENIEYLFPKQNLLAAEKFKKHLQNWKGIASRINKNELERKIYSITLNDISEPLLDSTLAN